MALAAIQQPANHIGRIQPACIQHRSHQTGGGGFAMRARNRNAITEAHQLSQHLGTTNHRNTLCLCLKKFGVIRCNGGRNDHHIGTMHPLGLMPDPHLRSQLAQTAHRGRLAHIAAANHVIQIQQHLGNTAHAHATDADEMNTAHTTHAGVDVRQRGHD